jgi:hypothetical protein
MINKNVGSENPMKFVDSLLAFSLMCIVMSPQSALSQSKPCDVILRDLEEKNLRLAQYVDALKKFDNRAEPDIANLLADKITELRQHISQSEKELAACEGRRGPRPAEGLGPVKSEQGEQATKSCGELRKRLMTLVKTVHTLGRREKSMLSELTAEEKKELREASEELQSVRQAIRNRCSAPPTPKFLRRHAKPPRED